MASSQRRLPGAGRHSGSALDDITLHGVDANALGGDPGEPALELGGIAFELEDDPAAVGGDVGAADVGDDVEVLAELVDVGDGDQLLRKGEFHPLSGHWVPALSCVRRGGR